MSVSGPSIAGLYGATQRRPLYSRFPSLYFHVPAWVKSLARASFASRQGSSGVLVERYLARLATFPPGDGRPVPVLLTHDADTLSGYRALDRLLAVEEALGLRSVTFLVTHRYRWDRAHVTELHGRGHWFGVHDTTHDNQLAYLEPSAIEERIRIAQHALGPLDCGAFRTPAYLRTPALYRGIAGCVRFDFSSNDAALLWPHPGDGLGSPFPVRHFGMVCVPTTLPRDGELLALGIAPAESMRVLQRKGEELARVGAPVVMLTHPDPGFTDTEERIAGYRDFLAWMKASRLFAFSPPGQCFDELARRATVELAALTPGDTLEAPGG